MSSFDVQTPDGKKVRVNAPEGSTAEQAMAFVKSSWKPEATPKQDKQGGFLSDVGNDLKKRFNERAVPAVGRYEEGKQTAPETALQIAGNVLAGGVNDVGGEVIKRIPGVAEGFNYAVNKTADAMANNKTLGKAADLTTSLENHYDQWAKKNPRVSEDLSAAGSIAGAAIGAKGLPAKPVSALTKTGKAAEALGMDTAKLASRNEGKVASALEEGAKGVPNAVAGPVVPGSPVADSAVKNSTRMYNLSEDNYNIAAQMGANVLHELDDKALGAITDAARNYENMAGAKGASEIQKNTNSFFQSFLNKLGKPLAPLEQKEIIEKTPGETMKLSTRDFQYAPKNELAKTTLEPASTTRQTAKGTYKTTKNVGLGERTLSQKDKTKVAINQPGSEKIEKTFTPNAEPHRPTTLNDLTQAEQVINRASRGDFGQIDSQVISDARKLVDNAVKEAGKSNPKFLEAYNKGKTAYREYKAVYGDKSETAKHFGLSEEDLSLLRNGSKDPVLLQRVNSMHTKIRTDSPDNLKADMEGISNLLGKEGASVAFQNKTRALVQEINLDYGKAQKNANALKTLFGASNVPEKVWEPAVDNLVFFSRRLKQHGVKPGTVEAPEAPFLIQAAKTLFKAASYATFDLPRSAVHTLVGGTMKVLGKEPSADLYMMGRTIKKSLPAQASGQVRNLVGPAVGAAVGSKVGDPQ